MKSVKEISKWLKEEVEFLKENEDYCGGWLKLDDTYAAVVLWEEGWGEEERDDVIQSTSNPDWALCAGVKIFNPADTVDGWLYPSNAKTGDMLCESCGIEPEEDYDALAKWVVDCYDVVKDFVPEEDGTIVVEIEEGMEDEEIGVKSGPSIGNPDAKHIPNNKDDAKAPTQLRKNTTINNKANAEESLKEELDELVYINSFKKQYPITTSQMEQALKKQGIKCEYAKKDGDVVGFYVERDDYDKAIKVLLELESDWETKHSKQESICEGKEDEVEEIAISSKEAAFDVLKKILDIHCEKGKCTIALKGTLDDEDEVKLYVELSEEDVENLCPEFHCEEESEEIKFSDSDEEVELVTIGSDEEAGEIYDFSEFEDEEPVILD